MRSTVSEVKVVNDGGDLKFGMRIGGRLHLCLIGKEVLAEICRGAGASADLIEQFNAHRYAILRQVEIAVRAGISGYPIPITLTAEMFFPDR